MRIGTLGLWAMPISLIHAATTGSRNGFHREEKRQESAAAQTTPKFEGLRISYVTQTQVMTETQTLQVTIAADPVVLTQIVTQAAQAAPVTVTETVIQPVTATKVITVAGEAATITMTETIAGTCAAPAASAVDGAQNGVGVSTVPLAQSLLPTTTFTFDPLATGTTSAAAVVTSSSTDSASPSSAPPASSASSTSLSVASTSTTSIQTMQSEIIMTRTTTTQGQATSLVPSVDLGGLQPDASAELGSIVQGSTTSAPLSAPSSTTRAGINISSLSLSSVLNLGNLAPATAGIAARATHAA